MRPTLLEKLVYTVDAFNFNTIIDNDEAGDDDDDDDNNNDAAAAAAVDGINLTSHFQRFV